MSDWIGAAFLVALVVGAIVGLKILSKPHTRTEQEFERNASESTAVGAILNALHDVTDPAAGRATEVRMQMKDGTFKKKKREGKAGGPDDPGAGNDTGEIDD